MRQTDIIDRIRDLILGAAIDASPENYEICHRFVTRSDPQVFEGFQKALKAPQPFDAKAFEAIRDAAGPARGAVDIARHTLRLDEQLAILIAANRDALDSTAAFSEVLAAGADRLGALDLPPEATGGVADLLVRTIAIAEHGNALEAKLASAGAEMAQLRDELEKARLEGGTDALTSLSNRRAFDARLASAIAAARETALPLSIAFCDIDHFKQFNDRWGHQLGDHVLRFVGSQMAMVFKEIGVPARFGGEEFVVLLPDFGPIDALEATRRFCDGVRSRTLRVRSDGREIGNVTLSAGVATLRPGERADDLIARADGAMYAAKQAGRDRVMSAA